MTSETTPKAMLQLLARHEMQIGAFYRECARQIPEEDAFWQALALAETEHARALGSLVAEADANRVMLRVDALHRNTLDAFSHYVTEQMRFIAHGGLTMSMLLNIALDLEQNLLEQDPLAYFTGDAPELQQVRETLLAETRAHLALIQTKRTKIR
jgi:hypothetical protein